MKIISDSFLLKTKTGQKLYNDYAASEPIFDYHCHLPPAEIAEDKQFDTITQLWLKGDHYKWRAMRTNGVDERFITGAADDWEKFAKWAETVPFTIKNPLYHWTHLELARYFGINDRTLNPQTARYIYDTCNEQIRSKEFRVRSLIKRMQVKALCTTDDPVDSLEHHIRLRKEGYEVSVLPTFRPDKGMMVESVTAFNEWTTKLERSADMVIHDFDSYLDAIRKRHDFFHQNGCRISDHGIETVYAEKYTGSEIKRIFDAVRGGRVPNQEEVLKFKSAMLREFAIMDHERGWVQQLHLGAIRNNSSRMYAKLGPDTGFDAIGDFEIARPLVQFLDSLDKDNKLPKTVLYNLNPRDNELLVTIMGSFQDGVIPGKMQFGSGWWFLDQKDGMQRQITALSNLGLLSRFIGMLTDSRSFLSYPRHEYFRRILCSMLGSDMDNGEIFEDITTVGKIVRDICYTNAKEYLFGKDSV